MELWELMAREEIRDLVARYNANGDAGRFAQVLELFTPDARMELVDGQGDVRRYEGHEAITTIFTGTRDRWDAEAEFINDLASASRVPSMLVRERIEGVHPIRDLVSYRDLTDALVQSSRELRNWRARVAADWGCATGDLALWLMEPYARLANER